jgi:hypothetical protein
MGNRSLTLPPRRKSRGIVFDAKPTDISDTLNWCDENMSADDMLSLIEGLQNLVRKANAEDDERDGETAFKRERMDEAERALNAKLSGMDSRRAPDMDYLTRFPNANRLKS